MQLELTVNFLSKVDQYDMDQEKFGYVFKISADVIFQRCDLIHSCCF